MKVINMLKNQHCTFSGDTTIDPIKTIKTFQDVCNVAKANIGHYILPRTATKNDIRDNAYDKLKLIISVFNQGWEPNYSDDNERKWFPYFTYDKNSGAFVFYHYYYYDSYSDVGSRLVMKSEAVAQYVATTFIEIYNEYML